MKLAIVVGHNFISQGAVRKDTGESEFVWNEKLARRIKKLGFQHGLKVNIFLRKPANSYKEEITRVYNEVDEWKPDGSIELHFNSVESAAATGTETLSSGTAKSLLLAEHVQREMVSALRLKDRGIITRARQERGGGALHAGLAPAILIEPFFGSSSIGTEATDSETEKERLAAAIVRGAARAFSSFPRTNLAESRTLRATAEQRRANRTSALSQTAAAVSAAVTGAREQIQEIPAVGPLAETLPYITIALISIAFIATVISNTRTDAVEKARLDDFERGLR